MESTINKLAVTAEISKSISGNFISNLNEAMCESDSGIETDFSHKSESDTDIIDIFQYQIKALYTKVLFQILNNVGCEIPNEVSEEQLFRYIQEIFQISNENHDKLFAVAKRKKTPEYNLDIEIVEAKDLQLQDLDATSGFFVTLHSSSNEIRNYKTSIQSGTLNPIWKEHFLLPAPKHSSKNTLYLKVWYFNSVQEKEGIQLVEDCFTIDQNCNLVGEICVQLDDVPALGKTTWYCLDKINKGKREGVLKIHITYSSDKCTFSDVQDHIFLLKTLLLHEIEHSKAAPFWWSGNFGIEAGTLLVQHAVQSGLGPIEIALAEWTGYCSVHIDKPLSFTVFTSLLDKLIKPLQSGKIVKEEITTFWNATKKLLFSCFKVIREISKSTILDKNMLKQVSEALQVLEIFSTLQPPYRIDLFPLSMYPWLIHKDPDNDIKIILCAAVMQGASDWFDHILEINISQDNTDESKMQRMIKIIQLVKTDLQRAVEYYDTMFQKTFNLQYSRKLYIKYEKRIIAFVKPEIISICNSLNRFRLDEHFYSNNKPLREPVIAKDTTLFKLYLNLQEFFDLNADRLQIKEFHRWFHGGIAHWLDIAVYKALQRIENAVKMDNFIPLVATVKYSPSADEVLKTFHQIIILWQQLNWLDAEGFYIFFVIIIDDIKRCCSFYADKMFEKIDESTDDQFQQNFEINQQWCVVMNNIDFVRQYLQALLTELRIKEIIQKMSILRNPAEAEMTLQNIFANAIDSIKIKTEYFFENLARKQLPDIATELCGPFIVAITEIHCSWKVRDEDTLLTNLGAIIWRNIHLRKKMTLTIAKTLVEGAENQQDSCLNNDIIQQYLNNNLELLKTHIHVKNFDVSLIIDYIWKHLAKVLLNIVDINLKKKKPPYFFSNLHAVLKLMIRSFKQPENLNDDEVLKRVQYLLNLNGMKTNELIHQVHLSKWSEQKKVTSNDAASFGILTVRCQFQDCKLNIEVINAENLNRLHTNAVASCNSFVTVSLLPAEIFSNIAISRTQIRFGTQCPVFETTFSINLTSDQKATKNGMIIFTVKNSDFLGITRHYMAEAFVHFNEISDTPVSIHLLRQMHLTLIKPSRLDLDAIITLKQRTEDPSARDFIIKYKQKIES